MIIEYAYLSEKPPFVKLTGNTRRSPDSMQNAQMGLEDNFDKVIMHQCIVYKLINCKEQFCIPDFICSNSETVLIVDAKIVPSPESKMILYQKLISYLLRKRNDSRDVEYGYLHEVLPSYPLH